jgi:hypothetical protein
MRTVADGAPLGGAVIDAHAVRKRIVIPVKPELMNLDFIV